MARAKVVPLLLVLIGIAGVAISIYLTVVHYARVPLVCSENGIVNCQRVLSSSYSSVAGVPVSAGGIGWFAVTAILGWLALTRLPEPRWLQPAQVVWSLLGLVTVLYLVGVELLALDVLCAWCTSLHVLILLALVLSIMRTPAVADGDATAAAPARAAKVR